MKEAIAGILQTRMDKCTTEQFWAIGALTAVGAFLICQKSCLLVELPAWSIIVTSVTSALYVAYLVIQRHIAYFALLAQLVELVTTDPSTPESIKGTVQPWRGHSLSGVIFYLACDVAVTAAVLATYL